MPVSGRHRAPRAPFPYGIMVVLLIALVGLALVVRPALGGTDGGRTDDTAVPRSGASGTSGPSPAGAQDAVAAGSASAAPSGASASDAEEPRGTLVIHGTGDVSLDPSYIPAFRSNGYGWAWSGLGGLFQRDDLTVVNLECPATSIGAPIPKTYNFRCDPAALPVAERYGVDVANQANNHGYDQGPEALLDSIRSIRRAGLIPVGAGATAEEADAPRYIEVKGWRIGVVGVGEVLDPLNQVAVGNEPGTSVGHDFPRALRAIREAAAHADLVVVVIHWGVELDTQPREYQVVEAHRMIDAGADVIFGHHSHRLQPMETYEGRPIFYGLGNFVWPRFSVEGSTTAVAEAVVHPKGRVTGRLLPATIASDGHPVLR